VGAIEEVHVEAGGIRTFLRSSPGEGVPAVFVHGNPTSSLDWVPFLERLTVPGLAPDLPCFGRSGRPPGDRFNPTMRSYARWFRGFIDTMELERYSLVVHDWGSVALAGAIAAPDRLHRLVVMNAVGLLPGYRWHWVARIWRRRGLGELFNAISTEQATRLLMRQARPGFKPMPPGFVEDLWPLWDRATRRAVLRLYRSADPDKRLPNARLVELDGAGHWPWIDEPSTIGLVADFVGA
jgi:pimeloyl-ACP methyl ester carboxylesterase